MIYVVEDDESIREIETYTLKTTGLEARGFEDGEAFFKALETQLPELIVLDVMLPGKDGIQILKELRANPEWSTIPVIMASAKGTEYDKVIALDLGADDYLAKPFGMMEMVSRVKAVLRRTEATQDQVITCQGVKIIPAKHECYVDDEPIELTLKEYEILKLFISYPGMVFTREQLLSRIWGQEYDGETRTVDVHIRSLRIKLGDKGDVIDTVRGVGYRVKEAA